MNLWVENLNSGYFQSNHIGSLSWIPHNKNLLPQLNFMLFMKKKNAFNFLLPKKFPDADKYLFLFTAIYTYDLIIVQGITMTLILATI